MARSTLISQRKTGAPLVCGDAGSPHWLILQRRERESERVMLSGNSCHNQHARLDQKKLLNTHIWDSFVQKKKNTVGSLLTSRCGLVHLGFSAQEKGNHPFFSS